MVTTSSLRQRAVRGAAWSLSTSLGSRAVGLAGTLLLVRYLAPDEYGVVIAASIAATSANTVTTFGVGAYLVSQPDLSRADRFHASCWFLLTGLAVAAATWWLGAPLARWWGAPGLADFLPVLLPAMLLERILYVPERVLVRDLRFGWLSVARALGELTYTAVAVILAAGGVGAMAIAWATLARSTFRLAAFVPAVHLRDWLEPHRLRGATLLRIVAFGMNFSLTSIATFGMRRWDNLLISRYFGPAVMGAYTYAYNLADTPAAAVGDQISDVIAASFRHVDRRARAKALVHACTMVSMIMFPLSIGLAAVAPTVVDAFFDPRWSSVGTMLMCLAALSAVRPLANVLGAYCYASRRASVVLWVEWGSLIGIIAAISTLGRAGVNWACSCVSLVFVLRTLAIMWMVGRQDGVRLSGFLLPLTRPLAAAVAMAAGVTAARLALAGLSPPMLLLAEIAAGSVIYAGAALIVARPNCDEFLQLARAAVNLPERRRAHSTPSVLSLSTEFPNPAERGKGLFVRSRLEAIARRAELVVVAPIAAVDYANPQRRLFAAWRIPRARHEGGMQVFHPRWLYPPLGGWTNAFFLCARLLPAVSWLRVRRRVDVIDAHFAHPEGIAAVLLGRLFGSRVFVTIRGSELRYRRQKWKRFWMSWALRRADRVIAVSENLRELAIELGADPQRVKTIPNGINDDVFFPRDRLRCRSTHRLAAAERIILSAGDLAELKGHHRVIAAVKALNDRGLRSRLLIAGGVGRSGRHAETLRRQVADLSLDDQVTWLGEVTQEALAELMSAADVFCLASRTEGWPNVVNEALACGTPVVATDVGAVRQMVTSDRCGYVVPVGDGEALATALLSALTRRWDHEAISALGRSRSWDDVAEEVLEEMRAVMTEPAGAGLQAPALTAARMERLEWGTLRSSSMPTIWASVSGRTRPRST